MKRIHRTPGLSSAHRAACVALLVTVLDTRAQTALNNPLMRPAPPSRETSTVSALPPGSPPAARQQDTGPVQAKSLQEEVSANIQKLNADRVPMPLRILLSTVYVSAIQGDTAVLRQPVPPAQQAALANQGAVFPGSGLAPGGIPGGIPGAIPGALPGGMNMGGFGSIAPGGLPGGLPGAIPGSPLSAGGIGLVNPFASPPPRPTSIRIRDGEAFSLQGYNLIPRIRDSEVTLSWMHPDERMTVVLQSAIESPSLPAYVPPASTLERPDSSYFGRVQPSATTGGTSGAPASGGTGSTGTSGAR